MTRIGFMLLLVFAPGTSLCLATNNDSPQWWPQFRGTLGAGHSVDDRRAPTEFGLNKNMVWKVALPRGLSSPCVWADKIFVTAFLEDEKALETICVDRSSGAIVWRRSVVPEVLEEVHNVSSPATGTAACDGKHVYVYFGSCGLVAYRMNGDPVWELPLKTAHVPFGSGTSPIIAGEFILLNRQQRGLRQGPPVESELIAVKRDTGEIAWRSEVPPGRCHSTPVHLRRKSGDQILVPSGFQLNCFDLNTGDKAWTLEGLARVPTATPVLAEEFVYFNTTSRAGDVDFVELPAFADLLKAHDTNKDEKLQQDEIPDTLAVLTRHRSDNEGDFDLKRWYFGVADKDKDGAISETELTALFKDIAARRAEQRDALMAIRLPNDSTEKPQIVWEVAKGVPEVPSLLAHENRIFAIRNGGILGCYNAEDGKMLFRSRVRAPGGYYASPVTDGTHVYLASLAGTITVFLPDDKFRIVASIKLGEPISATPAIVNGSLYVRTDQHMYAFSE